MLQQMRADGGAQVIQFRGRQVEARFTARDLLEFERWRAGERRIEVDGCENDGPGQFAMVYDGEQSWASWAIARENGKVLVWDCVTLSDLGRFECMHQALAALLGHADEEPAPAMMAQIISLRDALARRAAI
jgi:hypothetical protein